MSEQIKNINPWAEKLQQISIPSVEAQWLAMEALLDIEMPVEKKKRRFFFWIFLSTLFSAALLFGILQLNRIEAKRNVLLNNEPENNKDKVKSNKDNSLIKQNDSVRLNTLNKTESAVKNLDSSKASVALSGVKSNTEKKRIAKKENGPLEPVAPISAKKITLFDNKNKNEGLLRTNKKTKADNSSLATANNNNNNNYKTHNPHKNSSSKIHDSSKSIFGSHVLNEKQNLNSSPQKEKSHHTKNSIKNKRKNGEINSDVAELKTLDEKTEIRNQNNNKPEASSSTNNVQNNIIDTKKDSSAKVAASFSSDSVQKIKNVDSLGKQHVAINKTDSAQKKKHNGIAFAAGVGLNQSFAIAGQQQSNLNASGSILTDYIPVPMFRMYLNKKMYVEIEAQINSPQFTKNLLVKSQPTINSAGSLVVTTQDSGTINKLYYFNIPISIHYSPFKNFYIGAGLQFSMLNNGVGSFYSTRDSSTNGYSTFLLTSYKTDNLKSSSVFDELKKTELRFLFDANYQWRNVVLGVRYNQAFSNFINVQISNTQITQARNSSVQLYLRYILWKNKKAKELLSK